MNKKILLIALVLGLVAAGNLPAANLLQNPSFETGTMAQFPTCVFSPWVHFGGNGYYCADAGCAHGAGTRAVKIWAADSNLYQDFNSTAGINYNVIAWTYAQSTDNFGFHGQNAIIAVQWLNSTKTTVISTDVIGTFLGGTLTGGVNVGGTPRDIWTSFTGMAAAPTGASYGRFRFYIVNAVAPPGGSVFLDDVSVEVAPYPASNPDPINGSTVDSASPVTLSWTRPDPRVPGDTITCDVYLRAGDPNFTSGDKKVNKQAVSSYSAGTLLPNTKYYWQVDCYDPVGSGPEIKTTGMLWSFTTENQAPVVDAGAKQTVWMAPSSVVVAMNATVTDDGFPHPSALTYAWTVDSGPATPAFSPSNTVEDPSITFTVPGVYILRLTADDGEKNASDTVKIRVYAQGDTGLVAYWKLDETSGSIAADSSGNGHDAPVVVNGELDGTPAWTTGQVNGALELSGNGDYVWCGSGTWADFTEEMTVSAWIKCTFNASFQSIVTKGDSSWRLFRDSVSGDSNNASFTLNGTGFTPAVSGSTGPVGDNKWHQVVGTFDGANQCIYVDGILASSHAVPQGSLIDLNIYDVCIGADSEHEGLHQFDGIIDEVRLYEIGLPADMIVDQYIADGGPVSCGNNYLPGDMNKDCYVTFADFAEFAESWLGCTDVTNSRCE